MSPLVSSILLFAACVVGAIGLAMALPRRGVSPQLLGALIAALGLGGIFIAIGIRSPNALPNFNFYLFSLIALGSALRVISHPRPVYAALYFILTILASSGLYVLLSAEFMAFALVIVYAGAILITYLFVLMLATESPTAEQIEALSEYDRFSREPLAATLVGFVLVAALTTMIGVGSANLTPGVARGEAAVLSQLPKKVEKALIASGAIDPSRERLARNPITGDFSIKIKDNQVVGAVIEYGQGQTAVIDRQSDRWPKDLEVSNVEGVGFSLLSGHPGGIEVAGVVLLMAMLGAVVLARKKVEMDDQAKLAAQHRALVDERSMAALRATPKVPRAGHLGHTTNGLAHSGATGGAHGGGAGV